MSKKAEKLKYGEVQGLIEAVGLLKIETYKDSMEFNRITQVLQGEVDEFNNKQAELFTKYGAVERDGILKMEEGNPNIGKLGKEVNELLGQPSKLTKKDVEFMTEEKFDWSVRTKEPIPARAMGLMAKWIVREVKDDEAK